MTIGVDIRVLLDAQYSGVAEYTLNLLRALIKEDISNNYVLFYNSAKHPKLDLPELMAPNVSFVGRRFPNKLLNYGLFKFLKWPSVDRLAGQQFDIFWMPHLNFIAWPKAKNILTVHDLSFLRYKEFFSWRKNFWHRQLAVPKLIKRADVVVAISDSTKQDIVDLIGVPAEKIITIHSGVSDIFRQLPADDATLLEVKNKYRLPDRFILYLGTIEPRKNLVGLIEAYNYLREQYTELAEVKLVLAGGDGWKFKAVYEAAKKSPFSQDIKFLNYIDSADKCPLYNLAGVFAFPSFYEGFGFPPLEACACGTPVVASFASSVPEVIGRAGILIDPHNLTDIGEALAAILRDKDIAAALSQSGIERAKKFNWEAVAKEYLKLWEKK